MNDARRMGKSELFAHFAERFDMKRTQVRDLFDELTSLAEKELKRSGEFQLPGMVKLVLQKRKARTGRNPATGEEIKIPAKTVVKARIVKQMKDAVLPKGAQSRNSTRLNFPCCASGKIQPGRATPPRSPPWRPACGSTAPPAPGDRPSTRGLSSSRHRG